MEVGCSDKYGGVRGFKSLQEDFEFNASLDWEPLELLGTRSDAFELSL